jgi:glycosyltransferase involved in cell wall biosynthesis
VPRRLHFAIPGDLAAPTGGYAYDRRLIAGLREQGWEVSVVALPGGYPDPSAEEIEAAARAIAALPAGETVLVDGLAFGAMDAIAAAEGGRLRLAALVHHPLADETGLSPARAERLTRSERAALTSAGLVVCTSETTALRLREGFGVPAGRIAVARPGTERRTRAPVAGDPPLILCVGSIVPRKGHDVLIDALAHCADLPWSARFVGPVRDPAWQAMLVGRLGERSLAGRVDLAGAVDDVDAEYRRADIFVLASRNEGYGMALAEALAHGLPTVACAGGAVPELVPEAAGGLAPVDDAGALAARLRVLIGDADARARASDAAWKAGSALPTWPETARIVSARLRELAS